MNAETFLLERYKYILEQKRTLNDVTFKVVSLFQVIVAAVAAADYELIKSAQAATLNINTARLAINLSFAFFLLSTIACLCLLFGGIKSWLSYRADESEIELAVHGVPKAKVRVLSVFGWYETYVALSMIILIVGYSVALPNVLQQCNLRVASAVSKTPIAKDSSPKVGRVKS